MKTYRLLGMNPLILLLVLFLTYTLCKGYKGKKSLKEGFASLVHLQEKATSFVQKVFQPADIKSRVKISIPMHGGKNKESGASGKFKRCTTHLLPRIEQNVVDKFTRTENEDWDVWYPCGYTNVEHELVKNNHFVNRERGWVMGISGSDNLAAKNMLWKVLEKRYGRLRATIYTPQTWVTYEPLDMAKFRKHASEQQNGDNKQLYIMKKNIQRQEGLELITDPDSANDAFSRDYVVVQEILRDPYLVDGRKINIRVYILIVCKAGKKTLFVYDDGFVYYSKALYKDGITRDEIITTGYVSRELYEKNPLTLRDLNTYIAKKHGKETVNKFILIRDFLLQGLMDALQDSICTTENVGVTYSQTYGVDMQPNSDLSDMKIIEVNKGASLQIMDQKDGDLKQKMVDDSYRVLGLAVASDDNGFKQIWSTSNLSAKN